VSALLVGARQFVASFDRPNIRYRVVEERRSTQTTGRFHSAPSTTVMRALSTALARNTVDEWRAHLNAHGVGALPYHRRPRWSARLGDQSRFLREDALSWWRPSRSAWASTSPTWFCGFTSTCRRASRDISRRPAAPGATALRHRRG